MARGKKIVNSIVENEVASFLLENPDYTGKELKRKVQNSLQGKGFKYNFTVRTYQNIKAKIYPRLGGDNPLDKPWAIGSCIKHDIPADMIPALINIQQLIKTQQLIMEQITIREAKWFARLYSVVQKLTKKQHRNAAFALELYQLLVNDFRGSPQFEREHPGTSELDPVELYWLVIIGCQYANKEKVSELIERKDVDTSDLDNLYFIREDLSVEAIVDGSWSAFATPKQKKKRSQMLTKKGTISTEYLEKVFGKLKPNQVDLANDLARALHSSATRAREWKEQHPEGFAELMKLRGVKQNERFNHQAV